MIIHTSLHGSTPSPLHGDTKVPTDNWIPGDWARPMRRTVAEDKMDMSNSCCLDVWTYHVKLVNVNNECDIEGEKIRFFFKKKKSQHLRDRNRKIVSSESVTATQEI